MYGCVPELGVCLLLASAPCIAAGQDVGTRSPEGSHAVPASTHASHVTPMALGGAFTGLYHIPNAFVVQNGLATLAIVNDRFRRVRYPAEWRSRRLYGVGLGFLPAVEICAAAADTPASSSGTFDDRLVSVKWQIHAQTAHVPAVAIGSTDVEGTRVAASEYVALSYAWDGIGMHAGIGHGAIKGLFAGVELRLLPRIAFLIEHDSRDLNAAVRSDLTDTLVVGLGFPALRNPQLSLSWTIPVQSRAAFVETVRAMPLPTPTDTPPSAADIARAIEELGMEDVQVALADGRLHLRAESRVFANPQHALTALSRIGLDMAPPGTEGITVTLRRDQVDVLEAEWSNVEPSASTARVVPAKHRAGVARYAQALRPSAHSVDVTIAPRVAAAFGARVVPYSLTLRGMAELRLGRGWSVHSDVEQVAHDSLDGRRGLSLRSVSLAHTAMPLDRTWTRIRVGRPASDTLATQGQVLWQDPRGRIAAEVQSSVWKDTSAKTVRWSAGCTLSAPVEPDGVVSVGAARFARGDAGITLEVLRWMAETETALFAARSRRAGEVAWLVGARLSVPLGPSQTHWSGPVRIRPHDRFKLEYRTRTGAQPEEGFGDTLSLGPSLFQSLLDSGRLMAGSVRLRGTIHSIGREKR